MFSLKRKLDDLGRERQEKRFAKGADKRRIDAVVHVFGVELDKLKQLFSSPESLKDESLPVYPGSVYLGDSGVRAFLQTQNIDISQFPRYLNIIREDRKEVAWRHYERDGLHTLVTNDEQLSGKNVRLLTNDVDLLRKLASSGFYPPCPWIAFYELGSLAHATQGDAEYWYHNIWDPFWESLSLDEQSVFLDKKRAETLDYLTDEEWADWVEGIRWRDPRYRQLEH